MVDTFLRYLSNIHYLLVRFKMQTQGWFTCNTDGASNGNPVVMLMVFVYEIKEEFSYMQSQSIGEATNIHGGRG